MDNCLAVRDQVFADPDRDLVEMASKLVFCQAAASAGDLDPVGGDVLLGALVVYNAGHLPASWSDWWFHWIGNVASYRAALDRARELFA